MLGSERRLPGMARRRVLLYVVFVALIWRAERAPLALGQVGVLAEASDAAASVKRGRAAGDLLMVLAGVVAMAGGTPPLVDALLRISGRRSVQTRLGLTIVGFELIVLAWSTARRRTSEAVVADVVGSVAHNVMMPLSAGALTHPLTTARAGLMDLPLLMVLGVLALVAFIAARRTMLGRVDSVVLLFGYPLFIALRFAR